MSAEETKRDLPPGWVPLLDGSFRGPHGMADTMAEAHGLAIDAAVKVLGITRDEYKAMQRDRRAMNEVRKATTLAAPVSLVFADGEWGVVTWDDNASHIKPLIAALGESS